jgi:hypothetical protein
MGASVVESPTRLEIRILKSLAFNFKTLESMPCCWHRPKVDDSTLHDFGRSEVNRRHQMLVLADNAMSESNDTYQRKPENENGP